METYKNCRDCGTYANFVQYLFIISKMYKNGREHGTNPNFTMVTNGSVQWRIRTRSLTFLILRTIAMTVFAGRDLRTGR